MTNVPISAIPRGMEVVGVLQLINRIDDTSFFTDAEERVIQTLLSLAGPIISRLSVNFFAVSLLVVFDPLSHEVVRVSSLLTFCARVRCI